MISSKIRLSDLMPVGRDGTRGPSAKQCEAFRVMRDKDCLFYGGAGGGGKSFFLRWALLGLLLRYAGQGLKGVSVGLFSKDYPTLEDRQISKISREFPPFLGKLKDNRADGLGFHLHEDYGGGILKLRNLDDPAKYRSSEFAAIAVEELPENELETFHDLYWRLRWPGVPNPKFVAAGNPEGVGLWWVKQLWIDRDFTGELANLEVIKDKIAFVQARHSDNPNLEASYETTLSTLPEARRKAIKDGLWTVFKGQVFEEWRKEIHVVEAFTPPEWWRCWLCNDAGQAEPAAWYLLAASPDGQVYVLREWTFRDRQWHSDQAIEVAASLKSMGRDASKMMKISGLDSFAPRFERGRGIVDVYEEGGLYGWDKPNPESHPGRAQRAIMVHEYLKPFAGEPGKKTSKLQVFSTCTELIRTLPMLVANPDHPEEVKESHIDHWYDALSYGLVAWHIRRSTAPAEPEYKRGTAGHILGHAAKIGDGQKKKGVFT